MKIRRKRSTIAVYGGAVCQSNHGDPDNKGFVVWEIDSKEDFSCRHVNIPNPKPFVSIELTNEGNLPSDFHPRANARIRIIATSNVPLEKLHKAIDKVRTKFKPDSISTHIVTVANNSNGEIGSHFQENLRDVQVQEKLIKEYLEDCAPSQEMLNEVYALNTKYNREAELKDDVSRNISWTLRKLQWDNLFNYSEGNEIDFSKLQGVVANCGANMSGKTSIWSVLLYNIFNRTDKNIRKIFDIVNQNRDNGSCSVEIESAGKIFTIKRTIAKYSKKAKSNVLDEAKGTVDFSVFDPETNSTMSLNGIDGNETNKAINKMFGTLEDFLLTSMSSQHGSLQFINEGSTRRKEIVAKFLDLEMFEKKFDIAKEAMLELKGALKKIENVNFVEQIEQAQVDLKDNEFHTDTHKEKVAYYKKQLSTLKDDFKEIGEQLDKTASSLSEDPKVLKASIQETNSKISTIETANINLTRSIAEATGNLSKVESLLKDIDVQEIKQKKQVSSTLQKEMDIVSLLLKDNNNKLSLYKKSSALLEEVPCGNQYVSTCKFISEAHKNALQIDSLKSAVEIALEKKNGLQGQFDALDGNNLQAFLDKHSGLVFKKAEIEKDIGSKELQIQKNLNLLKELEAKLVSLNEKYDFYLANKEAFDDREKLLGKKALIKVNISYCTKDMEKNEQGLINLYKEHGSLSQRIISLQAQKEEKDALMSKYTAQELFLRCMHSNGIMFEIIKKSMPLLNQEIAKILADVVDFEIFFEHNENKLEISIKHPKYMPRPLENGSGAEKAIAAMAIRLALMAISNMSKSNIMILDEPSVSLDPERMDGFVKILDMLRNYFPISILITHIESLKDSTDMAIDISRTSDGFAHIVV